MLISIGYGLTVRGDRAEVQIGDATTHGRADSDTSEHRR